MGETRSQPAGETQLTHRRTGRGGCSPPPPKFWATQIFWATSENLGKASFERHFHAFLLF